MFSSVNFWHVSCVARLSEVFRLSIRFLVQNQNVHHPILFVHRVKKMHDTFLWLLHEADCFT